MRGRRHEADLGGGSDFRRAGWGALLQDVARGGAVGSFFRRHGGTKARRHGVVGEGGRGGVGIGSVVGSFFRVGECGAAWHGLAWFGARWVRFFRGWGCEGGVGRRGGGEAPGCMRMQPFGGR